MKGPAQVGNGRGKTRRTTASICRKQRAGLFVCVILFGTTDGAVGVAGSSMPAEMPHMITQQLMVRVPDLAKGRALFAQKACVLCHAVNGVGGSDAAPLDAALMEGMTDPFDFVANMWRGAPEMIRLQTEELGGPVEFTGEDLGNIIGFLHSAEEQKKFSADDLPASIRAALAKVDSGSPSGATPGSMNGMKQEE